MANEALLGHVCPLSVLSGCFMYLGLSHIFVPIQPYYNYVDHLSPIHGSGLGDKGN